MAASGRARQRQEPAKFHSRLARSVMCVRAVARVDSPDDRTNPGDRGKDQIADRAEDEDMKRGVILLQKRKLETENAVRQSKNTPSQETGQKHLQRPSIKSNQRHAGKRNKKRGGKAIALHRQRLKKRHTIGNQ